MGLLSRVYYNAVFGALGGLIGWALFSAFGKKNPDDNLVLAQILLAGAFIGGSIGYLIVSVDAIRDRNLLRFVYLASYGLVLGAGGGALGALVGDSINYWLVGMMGAGKGAGHLMGEMLARGLGWMFLGMAIGISEGIAARSLGKFSYSTIGGAIGGFFGGALFHFAYSFTFHEGGSAAVPGAVGLVILGACIGSLSALVQTMFQPASVKVLRGWQEGREYGLVKAETLVGREEHADVPLFRDMRVEKRHVYIKREGERYVLYNNGAPPQFTLVNDEPVADRRELFDGDRIQLGQVLLRFQMRAAVNRARRRLAPYAAGS
jgi:hypothetical protein